MANEKLIYASAARKAILKADPKLAYCIDSIPGVDAVEVVHGLWVLCQDDGYEWHECSSCRAQPLNDNVERPVLSDYCPNCGAKMDGGNEDG